MANKYREISEQEQETETAASSNETSVEKTPPSNKKPRRKGVLAKAISSVFSGTFLTDEKTLKHLPFIIFLAFLAIFYIANGYYADDKIREANRISNQLKELRSEYISTKSELMFASKQSEVAKAAEEIGLMEPVVPPVKIEVDSADLYRNTK